MAQDLAAVGAQTKATPVQAMIPVTVLTGFLGAGKTTLLNRILTEHHGQRIAVIENEFGEQGIDNEILVQDKDEQIVEMNNGCICCTVRGDLVRILKDLGEKKRAGTLAFDRVVIETTGMANPGPVTQTFFMDDEIADRFLLDAVITVVDAKHGDQTLTEQEEAQAQVGFADRLLLSKTDLVDESTKTALKHRLKQMNPRAPIKEVHFGKADIADVLDIRGFNLNAVLELDPEFLTSDAHTHDDSVKSFVFQTDKPLDGMRLEEFLSAIIQVYGNELLRYKGVLWMDGVERRMIFQGVHMMMGADTGKPWQKGEKRSSKMVFIGKNMPQKVILEGLQQCIKK
ncbi:MAG: CobW family GTP-binding protein [Burkholderiaceae bacterium]